MSCVQDSVLPMQEVQVWSLVGELRPHMPCDVAKKYFEEREEIEFQFGYIPS